SMMQFCHQTRLLPAFRPRLPQMRFVVSVVPVVLALAVAHEVAWAVPPAGAPADPVEPFPLRSGEALAVNLTPELLYRLLVAELSAQRGQYDDAAQELLSLAHDTLDPRLARRAFQMSMTGRNLALALRAARERASLDPTNPEAVAASLALSALSGQTEGLARTLSRRMVSPEDQNQAIVQAAGIVSKMTDDRQALDVLDKALADVSGISVLARLALAGAAWAAGDP